VTRKTNELRQFEQLISMYRHTEIPSDASQIQLCAVPQDFFVLVEHMYRSRPAMDSGDTTLNWTRDK
jgi:hypothetical protein